MAGELVHVKDTSRLRKSEVISVTLGCIFKLLFFITIQNFGGQGATAPLWKKSVHCYSALTMASIRLIRKSRWKNWAVVSCSISLNSPALLTAATGDA
jgi:hypothetical protein